MSTEQSASPWGATHVIRGVSEVRWKARPRDGDVRCAMCDVRFAMCDVRFAMCGSAPTGLRLKAQGCPPGGLPWVDVARDQLPQRGCGSAGGTVPQPRWGNGAYLRQTGF